MTLGRPHGLKYSHFAIDDSFYMMSFIEHINTECSSPCLPAMMSIA